MFLTFRRDLQNAMLFLEMLVLLTMTEQRVFRSPHHYEMVLQILLAVGRATVILAVDRVAGLNHGAVYLFLRCGMILDPQKAKP